MRTKFLFCTVLFLLLVELSLPTQGQLQEVPQEDPPQNDPPILIGGGGPHNSFLTPEPKAPSNGGIVVSLPQRPMPPDATIDDSNKTFAPLIPTPPPSTPTPPQIVPVTPPPTDPDQRPPSTTNTDEPHENGDEDGSDGGKTTRVIILAVITVGVMFVGGTLVVVILKRRHSQDPSKEVDGTAELEVPLRIVSADASSSGSASSVGNSSWQSTNNNSYDRNAMMLTASGSASTPTSASGSCQSPPLLATVGDHNMAPPSVNGGVMQTPPSVQQTPNVGGFAAVPPPFAGSGHIATFPPTSVEAGGILRSKMPNSKHSIITEDLINAEAHANTNAFTAPTPCARGHLCEKTVTVACVHGKDRKPKKATDLKTLFDGAGSGHLWKCAQNSQLTPEEVKRLVPYREMHLIVNGERFPPVTIPNNIVTTFDALGTQLEFADAVIAKTCMCPPQPPPKPGKLPKLTKVPVTIEMHLTNECHHMPVEPAAVAAVPSATMMADTDVVSAQHSQPQPQQQSPQWANPLLLASATPIPQPQQSQQQQPCVTPSSGFVTHVNSPYS